MASIRVRMLRPLAMAALAVSAVGLASCKPTTDGLWNYHPATISGTYRPVVGQFGGDEAWDILWYAPGWRADSLWLGNVGKRGPGAFTRIPLEISGDLYQPLVADVAGDDYDDIIWFGPDHAKDMLWTSVGGDEPFVDTYLGALRYRTKPMVLRDWSGPDRKDSLLWYEPGLPQHPLWRFDHDGSGRYDVVEQRIGGLYKMTAGDWSVPSDGLDDLVLYAPGTGQDYRWDSKGDGTFKQGLLTINKPHYELVTMRGETRDSVLLWGSGRASDAALFIQCCPRVDQLGYPGKAYPAGPGAIIVVPDEPDLYFEQGIWYELAPASQDKGIDQIPLAGDFDGDGYLDIFWYGPGKVADAIWYTPTPGNRSLGARTAPESGPFRAR